MFLVKYSGPFGFIKPWTAVRDSETFSQQFLTPSIVEGIEKKLFPELLERTDYQKRIVRHRLSYVGTDSQQEQTQPRAWTEKSGTLSRPRSILTRGVMLNPILYLGFLSSDHAKKAASEHICLCRNEDILFPSPVVVELAESELDDERNVEYHGFELRFGASEKSFLVGYNRFRNAEPMYGWLHIVGNPIRQEAE